MGKTKVQSIKSIIMNTINYDKLKEDLPSEAVKQHPTKTYLSSIKAIYVTERFNDVFGVGKWTTKVEKEHVNHDNGMVVVKVVFEVPSENIYYESFGGNDNGGKENKNFDLGDAYKGATTDAITKIGSYLGVGINVFKGKHTNTNKNSDLPWLNIYTTKGGKEFTKEAKALGSKIKSKEITTLEQVKKIYRLSKVTSPVVKTWIVKAS